MFTAPDAFTKLRRYLILFGFAKGLLFWYAIEKLFESKIGFSPQQIVLVGILAQGSNVIFELPTSVIADRWHRRNILLIAQGAMIACCVILGLSSTLLVYCVGTLFWSLSNALTSGVYEAFAFDSIRSAGQASQFQKIYSRMKSCEYISMALAGIIAGVLSTHYSLRLSFFLSIISAVICLVVMLRLPEPTQEQPIDNTLGWIHHIRGALRAMRSHNIRWVMVVYVCYLGFLPIWYEYYQLLGVDIKLSPALFGLLISVLTLGMVVGSEIARSVKGSRGSVGLVWLLLFMTHLVGLRFATAWAVFLSLFATFVALGLLRIYLEVFLQNNLSSAHRATIFSLASTLGYAWFFVLAIVFTLIIKNIGIGWSLTAVSIPLLALGLRDLYLRSPWTAVRLNRQALPGERTE